MNIPKNEYVCPHENAEVLPTRLSLKDEENHWPKNLLPNSIKYGIIGLLLLTVPVILFKVLILPLKLLLTLKTLTFANSALMATLIYKYLNFKRNYDNNNNIDDGNTAAISNGSGPADGVSSNISTAGNDNISDAADNMLNSVSNASDYIDIGGDEEDIQRILRMIKKKNKNW